tara:strand:+ start:450 stop:725 length:276 start_codon:yes stop_codon:yes gene_type:complete
MGVGPDWKWPILSRILLTLPFVGRLMNRFSYFFQVWVIRILFFNPTSGAVSYSGMINKVVGSATNTAYRAFPVAKESGHCRSQNRLTYQID